MTKYNTFTELKDAIKAKNPNFFKSGKALGIYKTVKKGSSGQFIELARMWGDSYRASLKEFDGNRVNILKSFESDRYIDITEARKNLG